MKKKPERKYRFSLALMFSGIVMIFLIVTSAIVAVVIFFLISHGTLQFGDKALNFGSFILLLTLLSLGIGAILAASTSRFSLSPINKILNAMNRLASGDYSARLSFKGPMGKIPTVTEFTNSFNTMAYAFETNKVIHTDFINSFSHEFKTPIVSVAGFAKLLRREDLPKEKRDEYLLVIEEESLRLSQMASNVLNLSKVENQSSLTDVSEYNLSEQLRNCILMLESKWTKKNIELSILFDEYSITASEELLKQVWINLIDNAIKFSKENGVVEISVTKTVKDVSVTVANTGDPIPKQSLDRIFEKFYQADTSHSTEGNGVGLAVVKRIVDLHGGYVNVDYRDGMDRFTVVLPQ
ncbi:MAG: HAMP domain-containing histidine kinase [Clostridia bacterium]|nr:HAMP domain-containing histidine kinase [Clostridia bacterium]